MSEIHYSIVAGGFAGWEGRTPCPPMVGDTIDCDGVMFVVKDRLWQDAESSLGEAAARAWNHGAADHVCLILICERCKGADDEQEAITVIESEEPTNILDDTDNNPGYYLEVTHEQEETEQRLG
jgi:hypothetical protein